MIMKKIIVIYFLFSSLVSNAQTIEETAQLYWDAVLTDKSEQIIQYGNEIINYIEKNIVLTRMRT